MESAPCRSRLTLPIAPLAGMAAWIAVTLAVALSPTELLEKLVVKSGIAAFLPAAAPPLGFTARVVLALGIGGGIGALLFAGLWLLFGWRPVSLGKRTAGVKVRRADRHPDAAPRAPLSAVDLGTPFLEIRARPTDVALDESPLPDNWDAVPTMFERRMAGQPLPDPVPAPATGRFGAGERIETFELPPVLPTRHPPETEEARPLSGATLHDLLARLEQGVQRRDERRAERVHSLDDALGALRQLAARVG